MPSLKNFLKPLFVREWAGLLRQRGLREFVREKGWRVLAAVILFYLVRDSILYLLLPYLAAKGVFGC